MNARTGKILGGTLAIVSLLLANGDTCGAQQTTGHATITINAAQTVGPVNRLVFGDNIEAADATHIYDVPDPVSTLHNGEGFWDDGTRQPNPYVVQHLKAAGIGALRYPGGTLANLYDWHKAVGPLATRGDWHFGIDEYIATCRAMGAEPQFIVSDYTGTPKDAAGLVEYLNAPAKPGHPWALLRARCGHAQPYHVHLFELGNETDNGGGYPRHTFSADEYVSYANATIKAMRAVDRSIKIGIISATGKPVDDPWNSVVFRRSGKNADFVVIHKYAVGQDTTSPEDLVMRGCMASADQYEATFQAYHAAIRKAVGHDLPLALTEYNGGFDAPEPPYRFSFGAALFSTDLIRVLLKPSSNILMANYWQAVNGYWGMLRGDGSSWTTMPAYPLRRLWGQHFGKILVQSVVYSPTADFEGVQLTKPARGTRYIPAKQLAGKVLSAADLDPQTLSAFGAHLESGMIVYDLKDVKTNLYPLFANIPVPPATKGTGAIYDLSYDIRVIPSGEGQGSVSLGLMDARGWEATHSAAKIGGAPVDNSWHHFTGEYASRPDTENVSAVIRVEDPIPAINARAEIKNISITASTNEVFPAYALVTASASKSADGKTLYVIAFNKSNQQDIPVDFHITGVKILGVKHWAVTGSSLGVTNLDAENVKETETNVVTPFQGTSLSQVLPAHSMTAFELQVTPVR